MLLDHYLEDNIDNSGVCWVDVPTTLQLSKAPGLERIAHFSGLITYHAIPKSSLSFLPERIASLKELKSSFSQAEETEISVKLMRMVEGKIRYLSKILQLHKADILSEGNEVYNYLAVRSYFQGSAVSENVPGLLTLKNKPYYDPNNGRNWGEYWLEVIDPAHRTLDDYKAHWNNLKANDVKTPPFFVWLEEAATSACDSFYLYLVGDSLVQAEVKVNGQGAFEYVKPNNHLVPNFRYLFVINSEGVVYLHEEKTHIKHASLSHGRPVVGSGVLWLDEEGFLSEIAFDSGHYLPSLDDAKSILSFFQSNGLKIKSSTPIKYYANFKSAYTTFQELALV